MVVMIVARRLFSSAGKASSAASAASVGRRAAPRQRRVAAVPPASTGIANDGTGMFAHTRFVARSVTGAILEQRTVKFVCTYWKGLLLLEIILDTFVTSVIVLMFNRCKTKPADVYHFLARLKLAWLTSWPEFANTVPDANVYKNLASMWSQAHALSVASWPLQLTIIRYAYLPIRRTVVSMFTPFRSLRRLLKTAGARV